MSTGTAVRVARVAVVLAAVSALVLGGGAVLADWRTTVYALLAGAVAVLAAALVVVLTPARGKG